MFPQHALYMFPFKALNLGGLSPERRIAIGRMAEGRDDLICIGRLRKILRRTQLDRLDSGGDAGISGQHNDARIRVQVMQQLYQRQT